MKPVVRSHVVAAELDRADGMAKQASATTYGQWLLLAEELRQEWALPTLRHVDRVIYAYTEGLTGQWPRAVSPAGPTP